MPRHTISRRTFMAASGAATASIVGTAASANAQDDVADGTIGSPGLGGHGETPPGGEPAAAAAPTAAGTSARSRKRPAAVAWTRGPTLSRMMPVC